MACPLFIPTTPLSDLASVAAPLGDLYSGHCAVDPGVSIEPDTLRRCCNFGYARGCCARAAQSEADAVRLLVRSERGSVVDVAWAVERNHHPVAVGVIEIETRAGAPVEDAVAMQAFACAQAYVRQVHGRPISAGRATASAHQ